MHSKLTLAVLFTGVLLGALDIAIVGPALPAIQASFAVDSSALGWVFTIYVLSSLISAPLLAKLSDVHGRRKVYVLALTLFASGSILVASAAGFGGLLVGRAVQALGAGGLMPVAAAVVADSFPVSKRGRALGLIGAVFGIAFVLGPLLGGLLLPFGWRWLFLINLPVVAAVLAASLRVLDDRGHSIELGFDWAGACCLIVLLTSVALGLSYVDAVSARTGLLMGGAIVLLGLAFWWLERRAVDPIFHPELLASRRLKIVASIAVATGLVEAGMVFLPTLAVRSFSVRAETASFMMLPLVVALIVGAPAAGRLLDRVGSAPVVRAGLALTVLGLSWLALARTSLVGFYGAGICVGLGLAGLLGAPLRYIVFEEAGESRRGAGQGLLTLCLGLGRISGAAAISGMVAAARDELSGHREALMVLAIIAGLGLALSMALRGPIAQRGHGEVGPRT